MNAVDPTTIQVRGRDVAVPTTLLTGTAAWTFRTTTLTQPRPGCLVLQPSLGRRLVGVFMLSLALVFLAIAFGWVGPAVDNEIAAGWLIVVGTVGGLAFGALGLWVFIGPSRHDFDRDTGLWMQRRFRSVRSRPLTEIAAVQVLDAFPDHDAGTLQLNLVLHDATEQRCQLSMYSNDRATWDQATRLAAFLGVPLLNHTEPEAILPLNGREVRVQTKPIKWTGASSIRSMALVQSSPDCLVLRPSLGYGLGVVVFVMLWLFGATGGLVHLVISNQIHWQSLVLCVVGFFVATISTWVLDTGHYTFDRVQGQLMRRRHYLTVTVRPLTDIIAIQLPKSASCGGSDKSWQLNLILNDEREPRWNLSHHTNLKATRRHAARLAEFLGVPLLDHTNVDS
jgi:hypothetical protein